MTLLCDFDRAIVEQAYASALAGIARPIATDACALCRELERPCLVHRDGSQWPSAGQVQP